MHLSNKVLPSSYHINEPRSKVWVSADCVDVISSCVQCNTHAFIVPNTLSCQSFCNKSSNNTAQFYEKSNTDYTIAHKCGKWWSFCHQSLHFFMNWTFSCFVSLLPLSIIHHLGIQAISRIHSLQQINNICRTMSKLWKKCINHSISKFQILCNA